MPSKIKNKTPIVPDRRSTNWKHILIFMIMACVVLMIAIPVLMYFILGRDEAKVALASVFQWGSDGLALVGLGMIIQKIIKFFEGKI
jgi:mannose/fructose/N-acetylgalactosamine-specific phosphotransferase system component IIC